MNSVFSRHESNRARLGRSRKTSCWPPSNPQTLQELERALLKEWDRIPQLVINSLIDSMPQSLQRQNLLVLCNERSGGHLSEHVITHNVRISSSESPHEVLESQRDSPKLDGFVPLIREKCMVLSFSDSQL
ncbi:hypothetical protein TNCV_2223441 [Trichonephila clavipes]|nr:hypothetical protein TNCV_2223441 [Trichonephila clavipes]